MKFYRANRPFEKLSFEIIFLDPACQLSFSTFGEHLTMCEAALDTLTPPPPGRIARL